MNNSRSKNALLNIVAGYISQIGILILSFIGRRIFLIYLSIDYLGVNGLYYNILSVLSLAEMGLGFVTQFFLYKPVAEGNMQLINSLLRYFRKLYIAIAGMVFTLGLLMIPFLGYIVNSKLPQNELIVFYIILLVNSCVSYFSAHNVALLAAYQDNRVQKYVSLSVNFAVQIVHILVLLIWKNYTAYVIITLLSTVANVVIINLICDKKYPFIKEKTDAKNTIDKKLIINNVKSAFVYKIGATIVNNTDNILISIMISTAAVGLYSNYYMVVIAIQGFIAIVTTSLISGIGNLSAEDNKSRMRSIFNFMLLIYHFIAAFGGISFFLLFNDLIPIWLGKEYMLDSSTVFAIAFAFYLTNAISPVWMYREANGLFAKVKYLLLTTAVCNIIFSIILGRIWGVFGILLATSIARMITQVWYEPHILFKALFDTSPKTYWAKQGKYFFLTLLSAAVCYAVSDFLPRNIIFVIIKAIIFFAVCALMFFAFCRKTEEFEEIKVFISRSIIKTKKQNE